MASFRRHTLELAGRQIERLCEVFPE